MAESSTEKSKVIEKQPTAKQNEFQVGSIGHQVASGANTPPPPPLDGAAVARLQRSPQQALRSDVLALQRTVGNRAVAALVRGEAGEVGIQAKLEVGPVNDRYEQEADKVARLVTSEITQRKPAPKPKTREDEGEEGIQPSGPAVSIKRMVQRKSSETENGVRADGSFSANSNIQDRIRRMEQGGRPLSDSVRRQMEPRFGADLSAVRIHTGSDAVQLSRDVGARAFTHGSHIAFGAGNYNTGSRAGRQLLAHELTHTIQQSGARPLSSVQRTPLAISRSGPKSILQRESSWESFKNWATGETPKEERWDFKPGVTPQEVYRMAASMALTARDRAKAVIPQARAKSEEQGKRQWSRYNELQGLVMERGSGLEKGNVIGRAFTGLGNLYKGDDARAEVHKKFVKSIDDLQVKIEGNATQVEALGVEINAPAPPMKWKNDVEKQGRRSKALKSYALGKESTKLVKSVEDQIANVDKESLVQEGMARGGLEGKLGKYEARSIPAAEKSASDSVMTLMGMNSKIQGYREYIKKDLEVLREYLAAKEFAMQQEFGIEAAAHAMGVGGGRMGGQIRGDGPLDDARVMELGGALYSETQKEEGGSEDSEELQEKQRIALEEGTKVGKEYVDPKNNSKITAPKKTNLNDRQKKYTKLYRNLEVTSMLYAKALTRLPKVEGYVTEIAALHTGAEEIYNVIDKARKPKEPPSQDAVNSAVIQAGEAAKKVTEGGRLVQKGYQLKKQISDESGNEAFKEAVGERAMSKGTRWAKKLGGIVANAGMRTITFGMKGYSTEDEAGGYRVGIKSRTILDDIVRKKLELDQVTKGLDGKPIRGLGGPHGARAYAAFKIISFGIGVIRSIASGCALWITIGTAGVGAPVGAVFASIAFIAAIAKAAFDLLLLVWSGAALGNTNDPRSRAILRGENTRQGLAFGEGVIGVAPMAGVMAGLGQTGLLQGGKQSHVFENRGVWGQVGDKGIEQGSQVLGNIAQNVGVNNLSHYIVESGNQTRKLNRGVEQIRAGKKAMRVLSHPIRSAFSKLGDLLSKKKKKSENKFISMIPELGKSVESLNTYVQSIPTTVEGGGGAPSSTPLETPPTIPSVVRDEPEEPMPSPGGPPTPSSPLSEAGDEGDDEQLFKSEER